MDTSRERIHLTQERDAESGSRCSITTRLERQLIILLIIVLAVSIFVCLSFAARANKGKSSESISSKVCLTPKCISTAAYLLESIDANQEPCDDFYSFACNNWIKTAHLLGRITSQFSRINSAINMRLKELLEQPTTNATEHEKKTKAFYKACMDKETRKELGFKALTTDLKDLGEWPLISASWNSSQFSWSNLTAQLHEKGYPTSILLSISVGKDIKNTSSSLILVDQPSLGLGEKGEYIISKNIKINNYKDLILELALKLKPGLERDSAEKNIADAFEIEERLAKVTASNVGNPDLFYNIKTLHEIEKFAPKVPWRILIRKLLPDDIEIQNNQTFMVTNLKSLHTLNSILEEFDNDDGRKKLANYIFYRIVLFAAHHLDLKTYNLYEGKIGYHQDSTMPTLSNICVATTVDNFHLSLTAAYAKRYMEKDEKYLLEMMFKNIQSALLSDILQAKWLDKETKEKALLKVKRVRSTFAFEDKILDENKMNDYYSFIEIGDDHFSNVKEVIAFESKQKMEGLNEEHKKLKLSKMRNMLTANAFYRPYENSIIIPIGILQEPFFSPGRPNYINYGSLGAIISHEYTHAFDNAGSLYDEEGNYHMWWSNQSWANFKKKEKCFIDQYNGYYEPKVESTVNGTLTLGENIADNGGIQAVYEAYVKHLERTGQEKKLPGLNFSERQMFWIAFASVWCRKQTNKDLEQVIEHSVHSPARFRVNGAVSNIKEFSEDFNCGVGSPLNRESRCSLWK